MSFMPTWTWRAEKAELICPNRVLLGLWRLETPKPPSPELPWLPTLKLVRFNTLKKSKRSCKRDSSAMNRAKLLRSPTSSDVYHGPLTGDMPKVPASSNPGFSK